MEISSGFIKRKTKLMNSVLQKWPTFPKTFLIIFRQKIKIQKSVLDGKKYTKEIEKRMLYVNIIKITRIKFATIPEQALCDQRIASLKDRLVCAYGCLINLPQILQ